MATLVAPSCVSSTLRPCFRASPGSINVRVNYFAPIRVTIRTLLTRADSNSMSQPSSEPTASESGSVPSVTNASTPENNSNDDVLVQYVVLRRDLIDTWPLGSVVTQGCHAAVAAIWSYKDDPHTLQYCSQENIDSMHKVTLEVKGETQLVNLSEKLKAGDIPYKLWIEQPENIPTCLATKPSRKSIVSPFFKKLKLCK
ncbi:hypothetical protein SLEP1_g1875 [Rubroshorea leprosula]|uniref:peptidyl-tRNA hydrolase n=1 Tax=Rubroshorea leprosula TaxID=152421 RepID=A0AAV5HME1_9ROSI|nr:hypothetical protein SLEP1_g1875 [Rubroshorea leprosula]